MSDLSELHEFLADRAVAHAVIGATALGAHGLVRATLDVDLLVTSPRCLESRFWDELVDRSWSAEVRRGDAEDLLAGSVRCRGPRRERPIDVVVGQKVWDALALERAETLSIGGVPLPVATPRDLVLLKLVAGGAKDAWDLEAFLESVNDPAALRRSVEEELASLPNAARRLWAQIAAGK